MVDDSAAVTKELPVAIVAVGLNYRTASVEIREKLTLSGCALPIALEELSSDVDISEAVILSTCNRLELYGATQRPDDAIAALERFLSGLQNIPLDELKAHLYTYQSDDAIRHLMQVACGLDSMILGESQILGQVTQAFEDAHSAHMTGPILSHLFAQAIHAGKRARSETAISRYTTSVSHTGVQLVLERLNDEGIDKASILVIGAGEMATLAAQALNRFAIDGLTFINRTYTRAQTLARDFGGSALTWYQLEEALVAADAVICATGAPHTVLYRREVEASLAKRDGHPLTIMDIAVPRDVEDTVRDLPGVHYFDIDDLQSVVDTNIGLRQEAIPEVEAIIEYEMTRFSEWHRSRQVTPVIKTLREWGQSIADDELEHTLSRLSDADERTRRVIRQMAHRLVNRLLHEPTSRLRSQANEGNGYAYAHAVRELFSLDALGPIECQRDTTRCIAAGRTGVVADQCNLQCILF